MTSLRQRMTEDMQVRNHLVIFLGAKQNDGPLCSAISIEPDLEVDNLRRFFIKNNLQPSMRGTILPQKEKKLDFPVRDSSLAKQ
jgi:hypothetical protein